jgi:hypothetical protein
MANLPRPFGVAPSAWQAFQAAADMAGIDLTKHSTYRIVQSIGSAPASAGFHKRDGYVMADGERAPYCAAVDISVKGLSINEIRAFLEALAWWGFAAWFRHGGAWANNLHIHAVYAGLPMKDVLKQQVIDFLNGRDGLASHGDETFYTASDAQDDYIISLFKWSNRGAAAPPAPPKSPQPEPQPAKPTQPSVTVIVRGKKVTMEAHLIGGRSVGELRPAFEAAGYSVDFNPVTNELKVD